MENKKDPSFNWAEERGQKWLAQLSGMEAMLDAIDEPLLQAAHLEGPLRIADLACGAGGTTLRLREHANSAAVIEGFDLSPELIEAARKRAAARQMQLTFSVADLSTARPPHEPYDRLISRFGMMFFAEPKQALANISHWLRPDGRFCFAVWGAAALNPWADSARQAIAKVIDLPPNPPDSPGPFRYGEPGVFGALLKECGFREVEMQNWKGQLPIGGGLAPEAAARFALSAFSVADKLNGEASEKKQEAHDQLCAIYAKHVEGGIVRMGADVLLYSGSR